MKKPLIILTVLLLQATVQFAQQLQTSNLPIVVITTENGVEIPDEPKVNAHLGIIWNGDGNINNINDPFNNYDGEIGIEIRGSSSQWFPKKNYAVETRNLDGTTLNTSILGFPEENDWILHGPYSDKSLMRNALAFTMAGWIMDYAPRVKFCEVVINGNYRGVYVFTEKIKRDINRVNISDLKPDENTGDELTGGYILKFDKFDGAVSDGFQSQYPPFAGSSGQTTFQYHYPKADEITAAQKNYIQGYINEVEDALKSPDFKDSLTGYRKYFDVPSFIDLMFMQEISRNVDGYRLSTYMYKDKDSKNGKLKMGPVWDFNIAFGNVDYCIGPGTAGWAYDFNDYCPGDFWVVHFWWDRMWQDPAFVKETKDRWQALRASTLSNPQVLHLVDSLKNLLQVPASRNFQRWPVLGQYVWPNAFIGNTYNEEVTYLRNWLTNRLAWMDGAIESITEVKYNPSEFFAPEVSPNPFSEEFTFRYYVRDSTPVTIELFNAQGLLMGRMTDFDHSDGANELTWTTPLPKGMYFYNIWFGSKKASTGKVVRG